MQRSRNRIYVLLLGSLLAVAATLTAIVGVVYIQVRNELRSQALNSVENRLVSVQRSLVERLQNTAVSQKALIDVLYTAQLSERQVRRYLANFVRSHSYVRAAGVLFAGGDIIGSWGFDLSEYRPFLELTGLQSISRDELPGDVHRKDAGGWYLLSPAADVTGLSTHLPITVYRFVGIDQVAAGLVALDLSELFFSMLDELHLINNGSVVPVHTSVYNCSGQLLESTRNYPRQRYPVLTAQTSVGPMSRGNACVRGAILEMQAVVTRDDDVLTAIVHDQVTDFIFAGSVSAAAVTATASRLSGQILIIGLLSLIIIAVLGRLLFRLTHQLAEAEQQRVEVFTRSIQATMAPHFLFNALDTMVGLASERDYHSLMISLKALSFQLAGAVRDFDQEIPIERELRYVRSYLDIQRYRYRDQFRYNIELDPNCEQAIVPRFCLQPVVENCFTHALPHSDRTVSIAIRVTLLDAGVVHVRIADDGPGCSAARLQEIQAALDQLRNIENHGIGLNSVHIRLVNSYGNAYGVRRVVGTRGFRVDLHLPRLTGTGDQSA